MVRPGSRRVVFGLVFLAWMSWPTSQAGAQGLPDPPSQETTFEFVVGDSGGVAPRKGTAWKVQFARGLHKGMYITGAWFKRDLSEEWMKVLHDARLADLFVPYHRQSNIRFFDLTGFSFPLAEVKAEDAGPTGALMPAFTRGMNTRPSSARSATGASSGRTTPTASAAAARWSCGPGSRRAIICI